MFEIDLDRLAEAYRLRPMSRHARERAVLSARGCTGWMLDIGGGGGDHAATWCEHGQQPIVVDPSSGMLRRAGNRAGLGIVKAESRRLPFQEDSCSLAYFHLSIHYGNWRDAIDEAFRVVAPRGRIEVWTINPAAIEHSSLGRWFPKVVEIDTARFPDPADIVDHCTSRSGSVGMSVTTEPRARRVGDWCEAVRSRFVSTLQLLDDEEIDDGLARFAVEYPDVDAEYSYELELTRVSIVV